MLYTLRFSAWLFSSFPTVWQELNRFNVGGVDRTPEPPRTPRQPTEPTDPPAGFPTIVAVNGDRRAQLDESCCLMLACTARGDPRPSVSWSKNGGRIYHWMDTMTRYTLQRDGSLKICGLSPDTDAGLYQCVVRNNLGKAERRINVDSSHSGKGSALPAFFCTTRSIVTRISSD